MELPDANKIVAEIISKCKISSAPVPLDSVLKLYYGLTVDEDDIEGEGYIIDLGKIGGQIILNKSTKEERKRYTLAHELGHWILHTKGIKVGNHKKNETSTLIERWCNQFAAKLLMPEKLIVKKIKSIEKEHLLTTILSIPKSFQVSREALIIRISEICPISIICMSQINFENIKINKIYLSKHHQEKLVYKTLQNRKNLVSKKQFRKITKLSHDFLFISLVIYKSSSTCRWLTAFVTSNFLHNNAILVPR